MFFSFTGALRHDLMGTSSFKHSEYRLPIVIQQFHTNLGDDLALLVLFDLIQLISKLNGMIPFDSLLCSFAIHTC